MAANSCADLASRCDLAIVGVGFDSEVEETIFGGVGILAGAKEDQVLAVASTIAPGKMKDIARRVETQGVLVLDIPMCRGEQAAIDGDLLLLGGGDKTAFEACGPAF